MNITMNERLDHFLRLIPSANWRQPPPAWNKELRTALSDRLVTVGFGGVLKLTSEGEAIVTSKRTAP